MVWRISNFKKISLKILQTIYDKSYMIPIPLYGLLDKNHEKNYFILNSRDTKHN